MSIVKKIYPHTGESGPYDCFKIVLLSDGFTSSQQRHFFDSCAKFVDQLTGTTPFNLLEMNPNSISVYCHFTPSNNSGPAINILSAPGRTNFDAVLNTAEESLQFNINAVNAYINNFQ